MSGAQRKMVRDTGEREIGKQHGRAFKWRVAEKEKHTESSEVVATADMGEDEEERKPTSVVGC